MTDTEVPEAPQEVIDALNAHFELIGVRTTVPSVIAYEVWNIIARGLPSLHTRPSGGGAECRIYVGCL